MSGVDKKLPVVVSGAGSSGGKFGGSGSANVSPDTLRSDTLVDLIEALGEGPIVGLVNGANSIYINQTPLQNADGTPNYVGVNWEQRTGQPDQVPMAGPAQTSTLYTVETEVKFSTPVIRTITDLDAQTVQVTLRFPALVFADQQTGDVLGTTVNLVIERRASGGDWVQVQPVILANQKVTSPYKKQFVIAAPGDGQPWDIRVTRFTADADTVQATYLSNQSWWESYATLVSGSYTYDDTALIRLGVDAFLFNTTLGDRAYHVKGLLIKVPANYDPVARTYTGIWNGAFQMAWSNNPAWIFYDLLTNTRYGLGEFVDPALADKWNLYTIAQYCDQLVPSGFNDQNGHPLMEPRYTFNGVINNRDEAYKVLQNITSSFRGMAYWSLGQVFAAADMPSDPVAAFTPANVIDGHFKYSGTAMKARHSAVVVQWNDPSNYFRVTPEIYQDDDQVRRFGWRQMDVKLTGCTSRGQAHRFGRWIIDSEANQTETVQFTISWDGYVLQNNMALRPGQIILVTDPRKNGNYRAGGRLAQVNSTTSMVLDAPFEVDTTQNYTISALLPDGSFETHAIQSFAADNATLTLATAFTAAPLQGADWIIQSTNMVARQYRVMAVQEDTENTFRITALIHDPNKYARVEQGYTFNPLPYVRPRDIIDPVTNPSAVEARFFQNGVSHSRVTLSWTGPADFSVADYLVTADTPHGFASYPATIAPSIDIMDAAAGDWKFYISARSRTGKVSVPVTFNFAVQGWQAVTGPVPTNLSTNQGDGTTFANRAPTITWTNVFPPNAVPYAVTNMVRVYDANNNLLRTEKTTTPQYTYDYDKNVNDGGPRRQFRIDVTALNVTGVESAPATISVSNPPPAKIVPVLKGDIGSIDVSWTPVDSDYAGALVWTSQNPGFVPSINSGYTYDGPDTKTVLWVNGGINYVWVGLYDAFGKAGIQISDLTSLTINDLTSTLNQVVPDLVTALGQVTTSDLNKASDGLGDQIAGILNQIIQDRDWNDQLHARHEQTLSVKSDSLSALISEEQTARVEADYAMAQSIQVLQADVGGSVSAAIAQEATARASADSALATEYTTLSTTVNGHTSSLSTLATSINGVEVQYGVIGTINGTTGGFLFTGIQKLDGTVSYTLSIEGNVIVDGSIAASKLSVTNLSAISANMGTVTAGVIRSADGLTVWDLNAGTLTVADS
jgi:predicted phage tail protein